MSSSKILFAAALVACCVAGAYAEVNCTLQTTCKDCVKSFGCYWCDAYATRNLSRCTKRETFQLTTNCPAKYYLYPTCKLTGQTLLILVGVAIGLILLSLILLFYCCCCRSGSSARLRRDEERNSTVHNERSRRQEERRQERQSRINDIRKKYGLGTEERYQKM